LSIQIIGIPHEENTKGKPEKKAVNKGGENNSCETGGFTWLERKDEPGEAKKNKNPHNSSPVKIITLEKTIYLESKAGTD